MVSAGPSSSLSCRTLEKRRVGTSFKFKNATWLCVGCRELAERDPRGSKCNAKLASLSGGKRPFVNPRFFRARSEDFQITLQITNKLFQPRTVRGEVNLGTWLGPLGRAIFLFTIRSSSNLSHGLLTLGRAPN